MDARYKLIIFSSIVMMLLGIILPLLMVVQVIRSSFFLNFLAYGMSVAGLFIGLLTVMSHVKNKRDNR
ncbi:MAG: hypothetical protein R6W96_01765 [Clostridia bacterium]